MKNNLKNNLKNKLILMSTALALTATLLFSAQAQNQSKLKIDFDPVYLPCAGAAGGDVTSTVRVTNNTSATIPSLTLIYLQTNNGKAQEALSGPLAASSSIILHTPKGGTPTSCKAWFFKK